MKVVELKHDRKIGEKLASPRERGGEGGIGGRGKGE